jgi:DNA-binding GntR family transcriptional regulator
MSASQAQPFGKYQFIFIFVAGAGIDCVDQHRMILDLIKTAKYEESKRHLKFHVNGVFDAIKDKIFASNKKNHVDTEVQKHPLLPHLSNHAAG